jgi:sigma-B regulation protein RsbU (phosphoserine phosphatase)
LEEAVPGANTGLPLGILEGNEYTGHQLVLNPGDSLILYTDGVTDALGIDNQPFGIDGLRQAVVSESAVDARPCRPDFLGKSVLDAVRRHSAGRPQNDDIALVCFGRLDALGSMSGPSTGQPSPEA